MTPLTRVAAGAVLIVSAWGPLSANASGPSDARLYARRIYVAADASTELAQTATELQTCLARVTGNSFTVTNQPGAQGIFLVLDTSPVLPDMDLNALREQGSTEAFAVSGDRQRLWIVGRSALAVDRGVYWYLDRLGCRWLVPNANWSIIPERKDITLEVEAVESPAFALRDFFGTGSFGRPSIDPTQRMAEVWQRYKRRNLLGGPFHLAGHAGESFALRHKDVWPKHPEYLAENNGKRQTWPSRAAVKFCSSNPGLQALWVEDRLDTLRAHLARDPSAMSVSVEPSDGGGDCECAQCRKLGSVSDRVFTLANLTARAVAKEFPGKYVNLYAYNTHAAPPHFPIEPNVIVSIVPYGFQRTGMTPEEFIIAWGKKCDALAMYDYWNIPDWSHNLPDMSPRTVAEKIRFWREHGVKYFNAESTYSGGSMGLSWYVGARLLWDPSRDVETLENDYFQKAFGPARAPIRRMYGRWGENLILSDHELALCYRDLRDALALTDDPAITARLVDLGRYVHYLRLWYEYRSAAPKTPERVTRAEALIHYIWRIYDSNMVQVFRLAQLINRDEKPALEAIGPDNPMWKDVHQLTDIEIRRLLDDGLATYQPLDFQPKRYSSHLVPLDNRHRRPAQEFVQSNSFGGSTEFMFSASATAKSIRIQILVGAVSGKGKADRVRATDPDSAVVYDERIPNNREWFDVVIPTEVPGIYKLSVTDQKNTFRLRVPENLPFVCSGPLTSTDVSPRIYFYVPEGTKQVAVHSPGVVPIKIFDLKGDLVTVTRNEQGKNVFLIEVEPGQAGQCWSFSYFKAWQPFRLLNCPNVFAYSPAGMMIPAELRSQADAAGGLLVRPAVHRGD